MNKRIMEIYALSVCFVSVGCLSIFGGILLYSFVELAFPETANSSRMYNQPPIFSQSGLSTVPLFPGQPLPEIVSNDRSIEEDQRFEKESKRFEFLERKRLEAESFMSIARSLIAILIASIVFTLHWLIAKKSRN